ncbi:helix-turn-helix domain-containing protein, partial [Salmonella enterica subsp. enterica serovar Virginia]|nr:helix-turn-helix domain-containing protein [Salmonella enterica subsp. enterica serovar Virginia]
STIEDHIAEIAMNVQTFPIEQFVPNEIRLAIEAVVSEVGSKKLRPIKEKIPEASYFQIRLVLAWAGGV